MIPCALQGCNFSMTRKLKRVNCCKEASTVLGDLPKFGIYLPKRQKGYKLNACNPLFLLLNSVGWLMGLEPTTTGITILDSTN